MENGRYRKRPINWYNYEVDCFTPHLFNVSLSGCGANALALLTGIPPSHIRNTNRQRPNHWKDTFMVKFLKERGFKVIHLTKCEVTNTKGDYVNATITNNHVLLMSQLMGKDTASWTVVHNELLYHNFETVSFKGYNMVNTPSLTIYVVFHPQWKADNWKYGTDIHQIHHR